MRRSGFAVMLFSIWTLAQCPSATGEGDGVVEPAPAGVHILMARGGIPAVFEPEFVPATEAGIPDSAWILGISIEGQSRAYSLNLLNGHEVVNDVVAGRPIAAVW